MPNNVTSWCLNPTAIQDFDNRIQHVLEHRNRPIPGHPQWKDLSDYIFAFDVENEAEGHLNNDIAPVPEWWCDRSRFMRSIMGDSRVLVATGSFPSIRFLLFVSFYSFPFLLACLLTHRYRWWQ